MPPKIIDGSILGNKGKEVLRGMAPRGLDEVIEVGREEKSPLCDSVTIQDGEFPLNTGGMRMRVEFIYRTWDGFYLGVGYASTNSPFIRGELTLIEYDQEGRFRRILA